MKISSSDQRPAASGPSDYFTGAVKINPLFQTNETFRSAGAYVTFSPGAHSAWHTHPLGQMLIVTEGSGLVQEWGGKIQVIKKGDVVWTPAGVKHWHGASPKTSMTHIAIQESLEGKVVNWLEKVSTEEYNAFSKTNK
ncbi:cupin domain-containing protein [Leptospira langatensis]|uniref:Cupin domain-containing protein n=2 Tax=Leptospira langatensis TaxID=2484983 RepID=A0A5F1ZXS6_9LEPT|nr:cupin domain-containing protein [Leptospira langatensis]TGL42441.1 cupin domain-containing protein [Leptospira langatensis]